MEDQNGNEKAKVAGRTAKGTVGCMLMPVESQATQTSDVGEKEDGTNAAKKDITEEIAPSGKLESRLEVQQSSRATPKAMAETRPARAVQKGISNSGRRRRSGRRCTTTQGRCNRNGIRGTDMLAKAMGKQTYSQRRSNSRHCKPCSSNRVDSSARCQPRRVCPVKLFPP